MFQRGARSLNIALAMYFNNRASKLKYSLVKRSQGHSSAIIAGSVKTVPAEAKTISCHQCHACTVNMERSLRALPNIRGNLLSRYSTNLTSLYCYYTVQHSGATASIGLLCSTFRVHINLTYYHNYVPLCIHAAL